MEDNYEIEPGANEKYFKKYGRGSATDTFTEYKKPLARCSLCVNRYGDAPSTDELKLKTIKGVTYLTCKNCWGKYGWEK